MNQENDQEKRDSEDQEDDWTLDSLKKGNYLPPRNRFINDQIFKIGAALAAILAVAALLVNHFS